jgi:hypothetical protein
MRGFYVVSLLSNSAINPTTMFSAANFKYNKLISLRSLKRSNHSIVYSFYSIMPNDLISNGLFKGVDDCQLRNDGQSLTGLLTIDGTHRGAEFYVPCSHVKSTARFFICGAECIDV